MMMKQRLRRRWEAFCMWTVDRLLRFVVVGECQAYGGVVRFPSTDLLTTIYGVRLCDKPRWHTDSHTYVARVDGAAYKLVDRAQVHTALMEAHDQPLPQQMQRG